MMATHEDNSPIGGMIEKPPTERDMHVAQAGEAGGVVGAMTANTTSMSFMAASEKWESNLNGTRQRCKTSESASTLGDWRSRMQSTMRQQVGEVTQLLESIDRMASMLKAHTARQVAQWLRIKKWVEDIETRWDERHNDNVLWGMGITEMNTKPRAEASVGQAAPAKEAIQAERAETARHGGG